MGDLESFRRRLAGKLQALGGALLEGLRAAFGCGGKDSAAPSVYFGQATQLLGRMAGMLKVGVRKERARHSSTHLGAHACLVDLGGFAKAIGRGDSEQVAEENGAVALLAGKANAAIACVYALTLWFGLGATGRSGRRSS